MTYRELFNSMKEWTDDQLDSDLTIVDMQESEAYSAELSFVNPSEDGEDSDDFGLDDNHPFFYI